jgi:hypothetical protein
MTKRVRGNCLRWALTGVISVGTFGCHQPSPAWSGTWKLIPSRSSVPGPDFTITITPKNEYQIDNGTYRDRFRCDGNEYPMVSGYTMSCVQKTSQVMDSTARKNGSIVTTAHWELSADGKILAIKLTAVQLHEAAKTKEVVYQRASGSAGFVGGWSDVKPLESQPQLLVLTLQGRALRYAYPEKGQYADLTLDGPEAEWHGPGIPPGVSLEIKTQDRRQFLVLRSFQGSVINQGIMKISSDGRTLVEEFWKPDGTDARTVLVYQKQ